MQEWQQQGQIRSRAGKSGMVKFREVSRGGGRPWGTQVQLSRRAGAKGNPESAARMRAEGPLQAQPGWERTEGALNWWRISTAQQLPGLDGWVVGPGVYGGI